MLDPRPDATISDQVTVVLGILCFLLTTGIIVYFVVRRLRHQRKKIICYLY
jgi:preprotein translocase subunit YajC